MDDCVARPHDPLMTLRRADRDGREPPVRFGAGRVSKADIDLLAIARNMILHAAKKPAKHRI